MTIPAHTINVAQPAPVTFAPDRMLERVGDRPTAFGSVYLSSQDTWSAWAAAGLLKAAETYADARVASQALDRAGRLSNRATAAYVTSIRALLGLRDAATRYADAGEED